MYVGERQFGMVGRGAALCAGNGAASAQLGSVTREPELLSEMAQMERAVTIAEEVLKELEVRLGGVLIPTAPSPDGETQIANPQPTTMYAQRVFDARRRIGNMSDWLQSLLSRLEV